MKHTFEMRMKDLIKERSLQLFTLKPEFFSGSLCNCLSCVNFLSRSSNKFHLFLLINFILLHYFWSQGKTFIGVNCGTNDATVVTLSRDTSGPSIKYKCACANTISSGPANMYCTIHYWECQT